MSEQPEEAVTLTLTRREYGDLQHIVAGYQPRAHLQTVAGKPVLSADCQQRFERCCLLRDRILNAAESTRA